MDAVPPCSSWVRICNSSRPGRPPSARCEESSTRSVLTSWCRRSPSLCGEGSAFAAGPGPDPSDHHHLPDLTWEQRGVRLEEGTAAWTEKSDMERKIAELETEKRGLERQMKEQKTTCEATEKREGAGRQVEEKRHDKETPFLKRTSRQLNVQLEGAIAPKRWWLPYGSASTASTVTYHKPLLIKELVSWRKQKENAYSCSFCVRSTVLVRAKYIWICELRLWSVQFWWFHT